MKQTVASQYREYDRLWNPARATSGGGSRRPEMPATGIVVSGDDPLDQGRLRIYCQALHDDPRNPESIPWAMQCSPFFGTINNTSMRRGPEGESTSGAVSYGMLAVPEVGAEVLLTTINGDPNSRVWIGAIPQHQQNNTWGTGRYVWSEEGFADGPYSGGTRGVDEANDKEHRIQPTYDNLAAAFKENKKSPEWLSRGADLQPLSNPSTSIYTGSRDQRFGEIQDILRKERGPGAQLLKHYADIANSPGYGWSGIRSGISKTSRVSRVYGMSTPGFHAFTMDDRHGNCRIRLRTTAGSQILLDDTNERIYFSTARGNTWQEMDWNGNFDVYAGKRVSVHAEEDMNFTAGRDIRLHASRGIHMVAGELQLEEHEQNLPAVLEPGQIRIHSMDDFHLVSDKNIRTYSSDETFFTAQDSMHLRTDNVLNTWSLNDTNMYASKGSILMTAGTDIAGTATKNVAFFAGVDMALTAVGAARLASLTGKLDISSGSGGLIKIMGGPLDIQATDSGINMQTIGTSMSVDEAGVRVGTTGQVLMEAENIEARSVPETTPDTTVSETPGSEDCNTDGPFAFDAKRTSSKTIDGQTFSWPSGADNMARACHNAGFRGDALVRMVAIMGQESQFGTVVTGPAKTDSGRSTTNDPKWLPSCLGPFQIRCLRKPPTYSGAPRPSYAYVDSRRKVSTAFDLQESANWAFQLQKLAGWKSWSGFTDGKYMKYMPQAQQAVDKLCGTSATGTSSVVPSGDVTKGAAPGTAVATGATGSKVVLPGSADIEFVPQPLPEPNFKVEEFAPTISVLKITKEAVSIQGSADVFMKTGIDNIATSVQCLRTKLDDVTDTFNASMNETLGYIHSTTDRFKGMVLSMATQLQTGLAQAANSVTPVASIAAMVQVINDINDVVSLIGDVQNSISAFTDFPASVLGGVNQLQEILDMDMNLSVFIPPELTTLRSDVEQAYYELREAGTSVAAANRALDTIGDIVGADTSNSLPTPPGDCP